MLTPNLLDAQLLLYRRQFILGPESLDGFTAWKRTPIRRNLTATTHPDLHVLQLARGMKSLTLLGFILDPDDPDASDQQILDRLFAPLCDDKVGGKGLESLRTLYKSKGYDDFIAVPQLKTDEVHHTIVLILDVHEGKPKAA